MLRIALDVKSGTKEFIQPSRVRGSYIEKFRLESNPDNRHQFLKGLLLYLMGERVSLYAFDKGSRNEDALWNLQKEKLDTFLSQIELKGCIKAQQVSTDLMSFSQHRKHGVPLYGNYQFNGNSLVEIGEHGSRLNERYAPFVAEGLFDIFDYPDEQLNRLMKKESWEVIRKKIHKELGLILGEKQSFSGSNLKLSSARKLVAKLDNFFELLPPLSSEKTSNNMYTCIIDFFTSYTVDLKHLKSKKYGFLVDKAQRKASEQLYIDNALHKISKAQLRLSYFMWRYLKMYILLFENSNKLPQCTSFGFKSLDYKNKTVLERLRDWLSDPTQALIEKPTLNASTEFYKGVFSASKYGVAPRAPVRHVRYDGVFELYVQSHRELEVDIQNRIMNSERWYLRVGKLSVGRLSKPPERIPSQYWETIEDDIAKKK